MPDPGDSRRLPAQQDSASNWLVLDVVEEGGDWAHFGAAVELADAAGRALARHARFAGRGAAIACIALSDDATVRGLNARYRGKDRATNVLSFPAMAGGEDEPGPLNLGDVILACETVGSEAQEQGVPPAHHLQHLVVHGLLHLLGFDHEEPQAAAEMERLEIEILATLGVADPYGDAELIAESAAPKAAGGRA